MDLKLLELQPSHYWTYTQKPAAERLADFQEALNKITRAAQQCGISIQEAVAATNFLASTGRNLSDAAGEAIKEISEKIQEQSEYETLKKEKEPMNIIDIPKFNIDDYKIEIKNDPIEWAAVQFGGFSDQAQDPEPAPYALAEDESAADVVNKIIRGMPFEDVLNRIGKTSE